MFSSPAPLRCFRTTSHVASLRGGGKRTCAPPRLRAQRAVAELALLRTGRYAIVQHSSFIPKLAQGGFIMMRFSWRFGALALFGVLASLGSAQAAGYSVLYRFQGGSDGSYPNTTLIKDKAGNLYGTTYFGGGGCDCGTMFRLAPDGTETVLHGFDGDPSSTPSGQLNLDGHGNLYGVAIFGGQTSDNCDSRGCGSVFRLAPDGTFDVLHKFTGSPDGANEGGTTGTDGLLKATHGNHYGTTELVGTGCSGI